MHSQLSQRLPGQKRTARDCRLRLKQPRWPSGIGQTVLLDLVAATPYTYTQADFSFNVARADSFSTVLSPLSISQAMGGVIQELYDEGTIQSVMDGKLVLYGSDDADVISIYTSRTGINVSYPGFDLPNPLSEQTDDRLIYVAGAGDDTITGTGSDDVIFGGDGIDHLFGGSADDFTFFDADDTLVNGGAGRDVAMALGLDAVTVNMLAQGLEVVIGGGGGRTRLLPAVALTRSLRRAGRQVIRSWLPTMTPKVRRSSGAGPGQIRSCSTSQTPRVSGNRSVLRSCGSPG